VSEQPSETPLLAVDGLEVAYHTEEQSLTALHDVTLSVRPS
jgi:ABC-type glutathione transport system ATPase component